LCSTCQEGRAQERREEGREKVNSVFIHQELGQDIRLPAGYYIPIAEMRFPYKDREVVYVVGESTAESCCCTSGTCGYVIVPGYVLLWKNEANEAGRLLSDVEPITDEEARLEIAEIIRQREGISNIRFL
jgi:hypothetical protein